MDDQQAVIRRFELVRQGNACEMDLRLSFPEVRSKQVKVQAYPLFDDAKTVGAIAGEVEDVSVGTQFLDYLQEFAFFFIRSPK